MSDKIGVSREFLEVIANSSERTLTEINFVIRQARALLSAPAVERQEPVYQLSGRMQHISPSWTDVNKEVFDEYTSRGGDWITRTLYTSPPAPVAVVLPPRKSEHYSEEDCDDEYPEHAKGWNACLDKVKELNQ